MSKLNMTLEFLAIQTPSSLSQTLFMRVEYSNKVLVLGEVDICKGAIIDQLISGLFV